MTKERKLTLIRLLKQYKLSLTQFTNIKSYVAVYQQEGVELQATSQNNALKQAQRYFKVINANIRLITIWDKDFYYEKVNIAKHVKKI